MAEEICRVEDFEEKTWWAIAVSLENQRIFLSSEARQEENECGLPRGGYKFKIPLSSEQAEALAHELLKDQKTRVVPLGKPRIFLSFEATQYELGHPRGGYKFVIPLGPKQAEELAHGLLKALKIWKEQDKGRQDPKDTGGDKESVSKRG